MAQPGRFERVGNAWLWLYHLNAGPLARQTFRLGFNAYGGDDNVIKFFLDRAKDRLLVGNRHEAQQDLQRAWEAAQDHHFNLVNIEGHAPPVLFQLIREADQILTLTAQAAISNGSDRYLLALIDRANVLTFHHTNDLEGVFGEGDDDGGDDVQVEVEQME